MKSIKEIKRKIKEIEESQEQFGFSIPMFCMQFGLEWVLDEKKK